MLAVVLLLASLVGATLLGLELYHGNHSPEAGSIDLGAIEDLREYIAKQDKRQIRLEKEVSGLSDRVGELNTALHRFEEQLATRSDSKTSNDHPSPRQETVNINEQRFLSAGFDAEQAAALVKLTNEYELEKLYLRDRAIREGWMGTQRFLEAMTELDSEAQLIEDELDEESFDGDDLYKTVGKLGSGEPGGQVNIDALQKCFINISYK